MTKGYMKTPNPTSRNQKTRAWTQTLGELRIEASKNEPNGLAPERELSQLAALRQSTRLGKFSARANIRAAVWDKPRSSLRGPKERRFMGSSQGLRKPGIGIRNRNKPGRRPALRFMGQICPGGRVSFSGDIWCYLVIVFWKKAELDANCANFHERSTTDGHRWTRMNQ